MATKKEIIRAISLKIVPLFFYALIRFIYLTCKKKYINSNTLPKEPTVIAFWHGELMFSPFIYKKLRATPKAVVLISDHFDGKLIAKTIQFFKLGTIHGSSNRSASRVLIQGIKHLKNGYDVGITPDGPRGPRHEVADGLIIMAQKTNSKIVIFTTKAHRCWQLNSWDKFVIPKPFSSIDFIVSETLDVSNMSLVEARKFIQEKMLTNVS